MKSIQILHHSLLGYILSLYLNYYFKKNITKKTKILQRQKINYKLKSSVYFIIKSRFLKSENMYSYLRDIRSRSDLATIIIIGSHINYDELFKNHYRVFGVIDTTENKSLAFIRDQVHFYLDALYGSNQNQAN